MVGAVALLTDTVVVADFSPFAAVAKPAVKEAAVPLIFVPSIVGVVLQDGAPDVESVMKTDPIVPGDTYEVFAELD